MKKLFKIVSPFLFLSVFVLSCQRENIDTQQTKTSDLDDLHVTSDVALKVSKNYFEISNNTSKSNSSRVSGEGNGLIDMKNKKVKSLKTFKDEKRKKSFSIFLDTREEVLL